MNIIQTYKTQDIPELYKPFVESIKKLNPAYNYMFFTDDDIIQFIKTNTPEYYDTFVKFTFKIQQIDFFRYIAIYFYGGLYLDLDVENTMSFDDLDLKKCIFPVENINNSDGLLQKQNVHYILGNYAFYAPKGSLFVKKIIDNIVTQRISNNDILNIKNDNHKNENYIYYTTGPVLLTQTYIDYENKENDICIIQPDPFIESCFGKYGKHIAIGTWKNMDSDRTPIK